MISRALTALLLTAVLSTARAQSANYLLICNTQAACGAAPIGSALNRIVAAPDFNPGPGITMIPDDGRATWDPPAPPPTTLPSETFINRFSSAEQQAILSAAASNWQINLWITKMSAAGTVDVTNPQTTAGVSALVSAGLLTQARAMQILDLTQTSP